MAIANKPDGQVFGSAAKLGEVVEFPDLLRGWGIAFEQTNGIPSMEHFNYLFRRLDENQLYQLQRGIGEWQATIDYPKYALVQSEGVIYIAKQNSKNKAVSSGDYWQQFGMTKADLDGLLKEKADKGHKHTASDIDGLQDALDEAGKKGLPVGSIVAFPSAVTNPIGFLKADGNKFSRLLYPDLYRVLGNKNILPNLTRSDVGMTAYFATDAIPDGWIAFDKIATSVTQTAYPELYRYLIAKYGSLSAVPKAEDRFIRNAGNGLTVGQTQKASLIGSDSMDGGSALSPYPKTLGGTYKDTAEKVGFDVLSQSDLNLYEAGLGWSYNSDSRVSTKNTDISIAATNPNATGHFVGVVRPKSLVLKLCIKSQNSFDDVRFWIKAFGEVGSAGLIETSQFAQALQEKLNRTEFESWKKNEFNTDVANFFSYQKIGNFEIRKFPDGTMIQTYFNDFTANNRTILVQSIVWAVAFVERPTASLTIGGEITTNNRPYASTGNIDSANVTSNLYLESNTGATIILMDNDSHHDLISVQVIAIGRWK